MQIPTGSYSQPEIALEENGAKRLTAIRQFQRGARQISVTARRPAVLNVGGPLTNSVTASRQGQDLVMDYQAGRRGRRNLSTGGG